ncbi:DNA-directed RNA polymerase III subunit 2 [Tanacetum coccineum]
MGVMMDDESVTTNSNHHSSTSTGEIDKQFLAAPIKSAVDKFQLVPEFLKIRGLVKQHLDSFNYFVTTDIKKIVRANDTVSSRFDPSIYLRYKDVWIGKPSIVVDGVTDSLTPQKCRLSDMTYSAPIYVNIEYCNGSIGQNSKPQYKKEVIIGRMPIMLRSSSCVLHGKDEEELAKLGECPLDPGGYFVVKGNEKVILIQEQLSKNRIIIDTDKKGCAYLIPLKISQLAGGLMGVVWLNFSELWKSIQASVMSSTEMTKSKTVIKMEKEKISLVLTSFTSKVPIMVIMKAMGMEADQEVVQMLGRDPQYAALLLPSIEAQLQSMESSANAFMIRDIGSSSYWRPGHPSRPPLLSPWLPPPLSAPLARARATGFTTSLGPFPPRLSFLLCGPPLSLYQMLTENINWKIVEWNFCYLIAIHRLSYSLWKECASAGVYTQQQALEFLEKKDDGVLGVLRDIFIPNIRMRDNNFHLKCVYVVVMIRRMMDAILNKDAMDDKFVSLLPVEVPSGLNDMS